MRNLILLFMVMLFLNGCSATWNGIKQDSNDMWEATKKGVHDATE